MPAASKEEARRAKTEARMAVAQVAAIASIGLTEIGDGYAVKVNLVSEPGDRSALPASVQGIDILYEVTGNATFRDAADCAS